MAKISALSAPIRNPIIRNNVGKDFGPISPRAVNPPPPQFLNEARPEDAVCQEGLALRLAFSGSGFITLTLKVPTI